MFQERKDCVFCLTTFNVMASHTMDILFNLGLLAPLLLHIALLLQFIMRRNFRNPNNANYLLRMAISLLGFLGSIGTLYMASILIIAPLLFWLDDTKPEFYLRINPIEVLLVGLINFSSWVYAAYSADKLFSEKKGTL